MTGKELAQKVRMEQWAEIMRIRIESGEPVRRWCAENNINEKTYYYWQRKLRQTTCDYIRKQKESLENTGLQCSENIRTNIIPTRWTQVSSKTKIEKTESIENTVIIEIGSIKVQAKEKTDMELLSKVCKTLLQVTL